MRACLCVQVLEKKDIPAHRKMGRAMQVALILEGNIYNDACLYQGGHVTPLLPTGDS